MNIYRASGVAVSKTSSRTIIAPIVDTVSGKNGEGGGGRKFRSRRMIILLSFLGIRASCEVQVAAEVCGDSQLRIDNAANKTLPRRTRNSAPAWLRSDNFNDDDAFPSGEDRRSLRKVPRQRMPVIKQKLDVNKFS